MELKGKLEKLRGWLPKEPSFRIETYKQTSQNSENSEKIDKPLTKGQTRALVTLGIANLIMLIGNTSYLVIYLTTPSIWTTTLGLGLWVLNASIMLSVNYVLYRNYRKQTRLAEVA